MCLDSQAEAITASCLGSRSDGLAKQPTIFLYISFQFVAASCKSGKAGPCATPAFCCCSTGRQCRPAHYEILMYYQRTRKTCAQILQNSLVLQDDLCMAGMATRGQMLHGAQRAHCHANSAGQTMQAEPLALGPGGSGLSDTAMLLDFNGQCVEPCSRKFRHGRPGFHVTDPVSGKMSCWRHLVCLCCGTFSDNPLKVAWAAGCAFVDSLAALLHPEHGAAIANLHGKLPPVVRTTLCHPVKSSAVHEQAPSLIVFSNPLQIVLALLS